MKYTFYPEAEIELNVAIDYYEECKIGLGEEFAQEIFAAIQRILAYPKAWTRLSKNSRRCITNRFPYCVIYQIKDEEILIVAITRLSQKPYYWKDRIE